MGRPAAFFVKTEAELSDEVGMLPAPHTKRKRGQERGRREYPRALYSVPLKLQHLTTGGARTVRGISLDISERGLGAMV